MSQAAKSQTKLELIGERMMASLRSGRRIWEYVQLSHGLELLLERRIQGFRLGIARAAPGRPSDLEVTVCRKAFRVPDYAEVERVQRRGADGGYRNVVDLTWSASIDD